MSTTEGLPAAVRAACHALHAAPSQVTSISISGLVAPGSTMLPLLTRAETLAREFEFSILVRLHGDSFEVRFSRAADITRP